MGILDSLFGKDKVDTYVTISEEKIREAIKETLPIQDEHQLERVVESIKSSLVPLNENALD